MSDGKVRRKMSAVWVGLVAKAIVTVGLTWYVLLHIFGLLTALLPGVAAAVVVAVLFFPSLLIMEHLVGLLLFFYVRLIGLVLHLVGGTIVSVRPKAWALNLNAAAYVVGTMSVFLALKEIVIWKTASLLPYTKPEALPGRLSDIYSGLVAPGQAAVMWGPYKQSIRAHYEAVIEGRLDWARPLYARQGPASAAGPARPADPRPGGLPGGQISEVMNIHSRKLYMLSTAPEIGEDYWSTAVLPVVERKALFRLFKRNVPDLYHPVCGFIRNNMEDAHQVHAQVRHVITSIAEDQWFEHFPSLSPPDGYSEGAKKKLRDRLGYDPI